MLNTQQHCLIRHLKLKFNTTVKLTNRIICKRLIKNHSEGLIKPLKNIHYKKSQLISKRISMQQIAPLKRYSCLSSKPNSHEKKL